MTDCRLKSRDLLLKDLALVGDYACGIKGAVPAYFRSLKNYATTKLKLFPESSFF